MHYGNIKKLDIANGPGVRVSLFVSGCRNHCKGCFQPQTWAFDYGRPFDAAAEHEIMEALAPDYVQGLTVLGGEPMEPENQQALLPFLEKVRQRLPGKDIWLYTGFAFDELLTGSRAATARTPELLALIDVLVDGRFEESRKSLALTYRGSENQRIIDVPASLASGQVTLWRG